MRARQLVNAFGASLVLSACGGGGDGGVNPTLAPTATTATAVLSDANPVLKLNQEVSIDFSKELTLTGKKAKIEKLIDEELNKQAVEIQSTLKVDLSDPQSLKLTLDAIPLTDLVAITWTPQTVYPVPGSNQSLVVYVWMPGGEDDGNSEFSAIETYFDTTAGTLRASIPAPAFQQAENGTYSTSLKVGLAEVSSIPFSSTVTQEILKKPLATREQPSAIPLIGKSVNCPFDSPGSTELRRACIERSMYNLKRYVKIYPNGKAHHGVDLVADKEVVYVPAGATTVDRGNTKAAHDAELKKKAEEGTGAGAGVYIVVNVPSLGAQIKFSHLSSLEQGVSSTDPTKVDTKTPLDSARPLAITGQSGAAILGGPHLHMEIFAPSIKICKGPNLASPPCAYGFVVGNQIDPFPLLVKDFRLSAEKAVLNKTKPEPIPLKIEAFDSRGASVSSDVKNAKELDPPTVTYGDPTRKICISADEASTTQLIGDPGVILEPRADGSTCFAWGAKVYVKALANGPKTILKARYSIDADKVLNDDTLSLIDAQLAFNPLSYWQGTTATTGCYAPGARGPLGELPYCSLGGYGFSSFSESWFALLEEQSTNNFIHQYEINGGTATTQSVMTINPFSSIATSFSLPLSANRVVSFLVTFRSETTISGTYSMSFPYDVCMDYLCTVLQSKTRSTSGTWFARSEPGDFPLPKLAAGTTICGFTRFGQTYNPADCSFTKRLN